MSQTKDLDDGRSTQSTSGAGSQAVEAVQQRTEVAREEMSNVAATAQDEVRHIAQEAKDQLRGRVDEQGAQVGDAVRQFGDELSLMGSRADDPDRPAARVVRQIGEQVSGVAERFEQRGIDGVLTDVKHFARRHPGQFVLGAAAAGFVVGRLVRNVDTGAIAHEMTTGHPDAGVNDESVIDLTGAEETPAERSTGSSSAGPAASLSPGAGPATAHVSVAGIAGEELGAW